MQYAVIPLDKSVQDRVYSERSELMKLVRSKAPNIEDMDIRKIYRFFEIVDITEDNTASQSSSQISAQYTGK